MRDVDTGLTTMQEDPGPARTSLAAMQTVETSEYGALYVDAAGSFVFQDRAVTAGSSGRTPVHSQALRHRFALVGFVGCNYAQNTYLCWVDLWQFGPCHLCG